MQFTEKTETRLALSNPSRDIFTVFWMVFLMSSVPALLVLSKGLIVLAAFFLIAMPVTIMAIVSRLAPNNELLLDRKTATVEIRSGNLRAKTVFQRSLGDLEGIIEEKHTAKRSDGSPGPTSQHYMLKFDPRTGQGDISFNQIFGSVSVESSVIDAVNAWLNQDIDSPPPKA